MPSLVSPRRILITTNHLCGFGGSELVAFELAEHFLASGYSVDLFTHEVGQPMQNLLDSVMARLPLRLIVADTGDSFAPDYDLVWVQHSLVPEAIIDRLLTGAMHAPMVWHHMSSFVDLEYARLADVEMQLAGLVTAVSQETAAVVRDFGIDEDMIRVFGNPAPDAFADHVPSYPSQRLARLLIVSNHAPDEVRDAIPLLTSRGVDADVLGVDDRPVRVVPATLAGYDAVLTIGKTVQYALSMGIPTFVYDHFGGEGWVSADNLDRQAAFNFSGRPEKSRSSAESLVDQLLDGFDAALTYALEAREENGERWRLSSVVERIMADERMAPLVGARLDEAAARRLTANVAIHRDLFLAVADLRQALVTRDARVAELERAAEGHQAAVSEALQRPDGFDLLVSRARRVVGGIRRRIRPPS